MNNATMNNAAMSNDMNNTAQKKLIGRRQQRGFSLIEMMVAITISLILLAGVIQIFLGSKASFNLVNSLARLQENVRFSTDIMTQNIGMAGFTSNDGALLPAFNAANTAENLIANIDLGFSVGAGTASDAVSISYESDTDCLGNATGGTAIDTYFLADTNLVCSGNGGGGATETLAEGVENMQILYGVDTGYDPDKGEPGNGISNTYVNADSVTDWKAVRSVRIAFLVSSVSSSGSAVDTDTYTLLDTPPIGPFNDTLIRRVFTRTIPIRNSDVNP